MSKYAAKNQQLKWSNLFFSQGAPLTIPLSSTPAIYLRLRLKIITQLEESTCLEKRLCYRYWPSLTLVPDRETPFAWKQFDFRPTIDMTFHRLELTTSFLIIVSLVNSTSGQDVVQAGVDILNLLKAEEHPVWGESPSKIFRPGANNLPNPDPNSSDLDSRKLRKLIGNYDARYMSVMQPQNNGTNVDAVFGRIRSRKELLSKMPSELKSLQFSVPGWERELGNRASKKLRLWLWSTSSCPVLPLWKDFGTSHWPRYINVGQCSQKKTCSFPEGMKCKPSKFKRIRTLWWYCNERLRKLSKGSPCFWVKFESNVVEECKCSC